MLTMPAWMSVRYGGHRVARPGVAAERRAGYDRDRAAERTPDAGLGAGDGRPGVGGERADREPPFGLPVLAGLPELASALDAVVTADRRLVEAVVTVSRLLDTGEVEANAGVSVEHWLGILARQTRLDRRLLLRLCRLLDRFPTLRSGVEAGRVSFAQLRGLGLVLRDAPVAIDEALNVLLGRLLDELQGADPDVLLDQVRRAIVELAPARSRAESSGGANTLYLQPNLTRTGGRFGGELDALGMAIVDDTTAPNHSQRRHPHGAGGARADNLLAWLTHDCNATDPDDGTDTATATADPGEGPDPGGTDTATASADPGEVAAAPGDPAADDAAEHAARGTTSGSLASGSLASGSASGGVGGFRWVSPTPQLPNPPVKLLARVELETLGRLPVELITRLTGGHLRLSTAAAKRLLEERGAELRTIVIDQGQVVGVGRATRQPPGWMADIILAIHNTCTEPLCDRPARGADLDHARPWHPVRPDDPYGTTDLGNIGPLCTSTNHDKERAGWHVTQTADGRRSWTHPRTGLTITTVPATWRPPGTDPPHQPHATGPPTATGPPDRPTGGQTGGVTVGVTGGPATAGPSGPGQTQQPTIADDPDDFPF